MDLLKLQTPLGLQPLGQPGHQNWKYAQDHQAGTGVAQRQSLGQETGAGLPLCLLGGLGRISSFGAQVDPAVGVQEGFAALANPSKTQFKRVQGPHVH